YGIRDFHVTGVQTCALPILLSLEDPPTALFCTENDAVTGALRALRSLRLRIGADVSLIGFDDSSWAAVMEPPLTMIEQPTLALEIGRASCRDRAYAWLVDSA